MRRSSYAWLLVALLWIVVTLNYLDRQVIYSVFPLIKADLKLTDFQLGLVSAAFIWVYGLVSPLAGYAADRFGRERVILVSLLIWSLITWLTAQAHSFPALVSIRGIMGISEACYIPAALALLSDVHGERTISRATGLHQSGIYIGIVLGGVGGGWLGQHYGWRFAFTLLGLFGICYAAVLWNWLRRSSLSERTPTKSAGSLLSTLSYLFALQNFAAMVLVFSAFAIANWVAYTWLPVYFYEKFSTSLATAGFSATFYLQAASVAGIIAGGWIADRWVRRSSRARVLVQAIGSCVAAPCLFLAGFTSSEVILIAMLILFGLGKGLYDANIMPVLARIAPSETRSTGYGVMNCTGCVAGGVAAAAAGLLKQVGGIGLMLQLSGLLLFASAVLLFRISATSKSKEQATNYPHEMQSRS